MTMSKAITTYMNKVQEVIKSNEARNINSAIGNLTNEYAGPANRFIRQEICSYLTGEKVQLVKAGISHMADYTKAYLKAKAHEKESAAKQPAKPTAAEKMAPAIAQAELSVDYAGWVGKAVIRKACKRKGEVTEAWKAEGGKFHVTVTLEDGSKRQPNVDRFKKLYNFA